MALNIMSLTFGCGTLKLLVSRMRPNWPKLACLHTLHFGFFCAYLLPEDNLFLRTYSQRVGDDRERESQIC